MKLLKLIFSHRFLSAFSIIHNNLLIFAFISNKDSVKKYIFRALLIVAGLSLFSCSTELDINGNKKDVMIVYGILDGSTSTQYIKINRAFLGEGNALEYSLIPDSTLYPYLLDVKLDVLDENGHSVLSAPLQADTVNIWKDGGVFFTGYQPYYRFDFKAYSSILASINQFTNDTTWLLNTYTYKLTITDPVTGKIYESESPGLGNLTMENPSSSAINISFTADQSSSLKFKSIKNGKLYEGEFVIHYYEVYASNPSDTIEKTVVWSLGSEKSETTASGTTMEIGYNNWTFFDLLGKNLEHREDVTRYTGYVDVYVSVGAEDLSTYIDVNQPSNSIIQERPSFSNISNGIGLFSSKYVFRHKQIKLKGSTIELISTHPSTSDLNFDGELPNLP